MAKTKKKKKKGEKILNDRPRKIFRKKWMKGETTFGVIFCGIVLLMTWWFVAQEDNYDPGERDISIEVLEAQSVQDHLWEPPLQIWVEPGSMPVGGMAAGPDVGIYPGSVLSDGWMTQRPVVTFVWDNLYEKIDGQETQYKGFGFKAMHYLDINQSEVGLESSLELYDMGEFKNALGVFSEQRTAGSTVEAADGYHISVTTVGALAHVGQYYFKFVGNADDGALRLHAANVIRDFAASGLEFDGPHEHFLFLRDEMGIDYIDISYTLQDVFQYDFAKDFWFGKFGENAKIYFHEAESPATAAEMHASLTGEFEWDYDVEESADGASVFVHPHLKTYNILTTDGAFVIGVEGLKEKDASLAKLEELRAGLTGSSTEDPIDEGEY